MNSTSGKTLVVLVTVLALACGLCATACGLMAFTGEGTYQIQDRNAP